MILILRMLERKRRYIYVKLMYTKRNLFVNKTLTDTLQKRCIKLHIGIKLKLLMIFLQHPTVSLHAAVSQWPRTLKALSKLLTMKGKYLLLLNNAILTAFTHKLFINIGYIEIHGDK